MDVDAKQADDLQQPFGEKPASIKRKAEEEAQSGSAKRSMHVNSSNLTDSTSTILMSSSSGHLLRMYSEISRRINANICQHPSQLPTQMAP